MSPASPTPADLLALRDLKSAADACAVPFVMIGAGARLLTFDQPLHLPPHRTTTDWDFGVRVSTWEMFHQLRAVAVQHGYEETTRLHVLVHRATRVQIDLVPFGALARDDAVRWPASDTIMMVTGFADAFEHAADVTLAPDLQMRIATPPLLAALKCFAFADRSHETLDDLRDLVFMGENYLTPQQESRLFEPPFDGLIGEANFEWRYGGALLLGRDITAACRPETMKKLLPILSSLCNPDHPQLITFTGHSYDQAEDLRHRQHIVRLFEWMRLGATIS